MRHELIEDKKAKTKAFFLKKKMEFFLIKILKNLCLKIFIKIRMTYESAYTKNQLINIMI